MVTAGLVQMFMELNIRKENKDKPLKGSLLGNQDGAKKEHWIDIFPKKGITWPLYKAIMSAKYFTSQYFYTRFANGTQLARITAEVTQQGKR